MQQTTEPRIDCSDSVIELPDGRALAYRTYGDPAGKPVIALHGTPGSRFKFAGFHAAAATHGVRLISVDRWGYGLSSAQPGARLLDYAADLTVLADRLAFHQLGLIGISGGGPFAVAAAHGMGARVTALALVAPVGLIDGPRGRTRLSAFHTLCFRVLPHVPGGVSTVFRLQRLGHAVAPDLVMKIAMSRSAEVDQAAMSDPDTRSRMAETFKAGLEHGVTGPCTDMALFGRPWGFDPAEVTATTRFWIGEADRNVPLAAAFALANQMPRSVTTKLPTAGHFWIAANSEVVMSWLAKQAFR
jgi:pimeloyl-ACP methyl ester carboxylesterase